MLRHERPDDYYHNTATIEWPLGPHPPGDRTPSPTRPRDRSAEIIAAFEQETGKQVELGQPSQRRASGQGRGGARGRATARFAVRAGYGLLLRPVGLRGPAGGSCGGGRAVSRACSIRTRSIPDAARTRRPGRSALYALPIGARDPPCPRLEEPAGTGRVQPRRHPKAVGGVLVVLVRSGPARRAPALGRDDIWGVGWHVGRMTPGSGSSSSCRPTRPTT